jgi:tRNA uridine 5-carbamoylmethylation protein Kti12
MLSDEEKKALDNIKSLLLYSKEHEYFSPFQEQEIDDMNIVVNLIEKQSKEIEKLKAKNKKYEEIICRIRNLSSGVVSYDIVNGKKYLGPRKNFSKQRLYEQFLNIEEILKGNYIFLSNEEFLKELLERRNEN